MLSLSIHLLNSLASCTETFLHPSSHPALAGPPRSLFSEGRKRFMLFGTSETGVQIRTESVHYTQQGVWRWHAAVPREVLRGETQKFSPRKQTRVALIDDMRRPAFITACGFSKEGLERVAASSPSDEQGGKAKKCICTETSLEVKGLRLRYCIHHHRLLWSRCKIENVTWRLVSATP